MPAPTPSTIRIGGLTGRDSGRRDLRGLRGEQPLADLPQRDGQRLLLNPGLYQRAEVLQHALAELRVVGVDLAGPLRRHDHQTVLAVHDIKQIVDRRVDNAFWGGSPCHFVPSSQVRVHSAGWAAIKATSRPHTSSTDVLTRVISNSLPASSSARAASSRALTTSGGSVSRPVSRRTSSVQDGGARKTRSAPGTAWRTCRAPATSISSSDGMPARSFSSSGARGVPYLFPANRAHSRSSPAAAIPSKSRSPTKQYSRPSTSPGLG